jgi:hypothetical protein
MPISGSADTRITRSAQHIVHQPVGPLIAEVRGMKNMMRIALALALLLMVYGVSPAVAESMTSASPGMLSGLEGFAVRIFGRLPESGALLIWGTGLALASRAVARRRDDSGKVTPPNS